MSPKTATIRIDDIKEPDAWPQLCDDLELSEATRERYFEHGEYARLELTFDASVSVISGRLVPRGESASPEPCGCEESVVLRAEVERLRQALHDRLAAEATRARLKATP